MARELQGLESFHMERRNNALAYTLRQVPIFVVGDRAWLHDAASTIRQWVKAGMCVTVLNARFALNWTGPYTIFVIDPCLSGATREGSTKLCDWICPRTSPARMLTAASPWTAASSVLTSKTTATCLGIFPMG